jgi:hypothetical protein
MGSQIHYKVFEILVLVRSRRILCYISVYRILNAYKYRLCIATKWQSDHVIFPHPKFLPDDF